MAKEYDFKTQGVCASKVHFELDDENRVHNVAFTGGCNGNLKAIGKLVEGMEADKVAEILKGNLCGMRSTSCADQFSKALTGALASA